jgi:putative transposase
MRPTPYSTDLTNREWAVLAPLLPPAKPGGRPSSANLRRILDAIFYVLRSGCECAPLATRVPALVHRL